MRIASVDRPDARRDQLCQMAIGIAKVDAVAAALPMDPALDSHAMIAQTRLPSGQVSGRNRECKVQFAVAAVRWNDTAGNSDGFSRSVFLEQQEHLFIRYVQRAKAVIALQNRKAENVLVEFARARHILDVQRGFEDAGHFHTRTSRRPVSSNRIGNFAASSRLCVTTIRMVLRARCRSNSRDATALAED